MPTPFTHLAIAHQLENDPQIPETDRDFFREHHSAYLSGSIVADAKPAPTTDREVTHFYHYEKPMTDHPWRVMFQHHPVLLTPKSPAHRAFMAGYVAHLAADEYWLLHMLKPHFADSAWGEDLYNRFFWLHLLLIHMDERDLPQLPIEDTPDLIACAPQNWLPFLSDTRICEWNSFIAEQIPDKSETLLIFGKRIHTTPETLRSIADDTGLMQDKLWQYVTPKILSDVESAMYDFAREQLLIYLGESSGGG